MTTAATATRRAALLGAAALAAACGRGDAPKPADDGLLVNQQTSAGLPAGKPDPATNTFAPALGVDLAKFEKRPSGLYVRDDKPGTGPVAAAGQQVMVQYTGYLADGKQFDSSRGGSPYVFVPGQNEVIKAWDEGVPGMKVGGQRTLVVPADLGYGAAGAPPDIPSNSVLVFKLELMGVR
jgi:hypothetical protein